MAAEGDKDYARWFLRYMRNARILPILQAAQADANLTPAIVDLPQLAADLKSLESECHPLFEDDKKAQMQEIRSHLALIAEHIRTDTQMSADLLRLADLFRLPIFGRS